MFLMRRAYGGESEIDHNPLRQNEHDRIAVFVDGETSIFQTKAKPLPSQNWKKRKWKRKQFRMKPVLPAAITTTSYSTNTSIPMKSGKKSSREKCILFAHFLNDYGSRDGNVAKTKTDPNEQKKMWKITAISEEDDAQ